MSQPVYITEVIGEVVALASAKVLEELQKTDPTITGVHYLYGHYSDIRERLIAKAKVNELSFPLVVLFEDFKIQHRTNVPGVTGLADMTLIILHTSKNDVTREQRQERVFKPILYPIYLAFLKALKDSGKFMIYNAAAIQHDQINRPHWGDPALYGNKGYLFDRCLDGIELSNLQLQTYLKNCQ